MSTPRPLRVVATDPRDLAGLPPEMIIRADRFLEGGGEVDAPRATVLNLCRTFGHGGRGYYVSLLAEARGQAVLPTVETAAGLAEPYVRTRALQEAGVATVGPDEMTLRRRERKNGHAPEDPPGANGAPPNGPPANGAAVALRAFPAPLVRDPDGAVRLATAEEIAETYVYLGTCHDERFRRAASAVFREWPAPLLRMQLVREGGEWKVTQVALASPQHLAEEERARLVHAILNGQGALRRRESKSEAVRASIGVLLDPADRFRASFPETIDRLARVAARMDVHVARIGLGDLRRLPEYDALFIRSLTGVSQPAFQFALRAEALGIPVIDDTQSIIRCGNKVFLEELLRRAGVPTPKSLVVTGATPWEMIRAALGLPVVLKLPEGSFSAAVYRVGDEAEYRALARTLFRRSPLLLAQEWLPTDYDWRVGVLGGRVLFAARYYMAKGHWQIRREEQGDVRYGRVQAFPRDGAPRAVVETALRAARLIGDGFYGVDLKDTPAGPVVIEINDNPNLDAGYEDAADGNVIYEDIVNFFLRRIEAAAPDVRAGAAVAEEEPALKRLREPIHLRSAVEPDGTPFRLFAVAGIELEYPVVDRDLNVVSLVEPAFRAFAGRPTSDMDLHGIAFSNEIADHVFEVKTGAPVRHLVDAEEGLVEGVRRFQGLLRAEFGARLLPTGMHPWLDPRSARLWQRSNSRIYETYARLFDVGTHGWMNVQAMHLNLPFGPTEEETIAMHSAAALLIPYLPAIAASSPVHDGELQPAVDNRLAWILQHQSRVPESGGRIVPEYVTSFADYRRRIFRPMFEALDRLPGSEPIRHEFFNTRGAILRFHRKALELRVLDAQECVRMDVAIAAFARAALKHLTGRILKGGIALPEHDLLVADFHATIREGSRAMVHAPHVRGVDRDGDGRAPVRQVLRRLLDSARREVPRADAHYLDLVAGVIEAGSLSERIRDALLPYVDGPGDDFTEAARRIYVELADCLEENEPWRGRGL